MKPRWSIPSWPSKNRYTPNEIFCNPIGKSIGLRPPQIFPNLEVRVQIKLQFYENMEFDKRMLITKNMGMYIEM